MAEKSYHSLSSNWVTIQDGQTGILADFPHHPLKMTFDIPFQNTPPAGQIRVYSVPTEKGILVLSTYHSFTLHFDKLQKEQLYHFFETLLVPHFFFNPEVFQDHQVFNFRPIELEGQEAASFQFSFHDQEVVKRLEGIAFIKDQILYISFYLVSEKDFDQKILDRFLSSIQFP